MKIVLFDFDRTLTKRDTLRGLAHYFARKHRQYAGLVFFYFVLCLARLKLVSDKRMKEVFLRAFLKGKHVSQVNSDVKIFFEKTLNSLLNPNVFQSLQQHRNKGDKIFLVSANFDFFLEPLIQFWGLNGIISTETQKQGEAFTGKIIGDTCKGKVKVAKIRASFSSEEIARMVAYGDSDDHQMLGMVSEAIRV